MVTQGNPSKSEFLWDVLREIPDPEMPAINLVELGVIRNAVENQYENSVEVTITPTYTGCPAKQLFRDLIVEKLEEKGYSKVMVTYQLNPAWTTDWLSEQTKQKMEDEGIAPPVIHRQQITCPHCKSTDNRLLSRYGSTPCQSLYVCNSCLETFPYFKCHR